ncbi:flavodoxin domain-containing protein [Agrococcus sp. HG114]|uniref:flavodoxin family protein n=1 Tax=Agrococcus sp. HG114 TaxID=2969757 RepID=UPI00215A321E|nr:flavodoxin domain-containing protein [Agrococcus sp. HG114]MCR8669611.1 flavodoxin domain-containing protein [Agrococcus sp. HG114]
MRALVVYESLWGNTEAVARAIAEQLGQSMEVEIVDADAAARSTDGFDLVVVGGPTHAFSMSRPSTRQNAVDQHGAPHAPRRGIREWLHELEPTRGTLAATFDTRVDKPRLPGSAARAAKQELRSLGFEIVMKQESFRVHDYGGPLLDGETERAAEWARTIANAALATGR